MNPVFAPGGNIDAIRSAVAQAARALTGPSSSHKPSSGKTIDDFIAELGEKNKTLADWARSHGFDIQATYAVLRGRAVGRRGQAREIYIAMGLTPPPMFGPRPPVPRTNVRPRVAQSATAVTSA